MSKEDFAKAMTFLGIAYNKDFTQEQLAVWYKFFYDVDQEVFKLAVKRIVMREKYVPSVAMLREEIANIKNPSIELEAEEEWTKVIQLVYKYGRNGYENAYESMTDLSLEVVKRIGWTRICNSEFLVNEKKQFIELFNILKKRKKTDELFSALPKVDEILQLN